MHDIYKSYLFYPALLYTFERFLPRLFFVALNKKSPFVDSKMGYISISIIDDSSRLWNSSLALVFLARFFTLFRSLTNFSSLFLRSALIPIFWLTSKFWLIYDSIFFSSLFSNFFQNFFYLNPSILVIQFFCNIFWLRGDNYDIIKWKKYTHTYNFIIGLISNTSIYM